MSRPPLEVARAHNPGPLTLEGTRSYVVGRSRVVIVDPGPPDEAHLARLRTAIGDRPVEAVCLTHAHQDHAGLAAAACDAFGTRVGASAETLRRTGLEGRALSDGDEIPVDGGESTVRTLETPGHTADCLCFLWLPSRGLFTGDLVLGRGSSVILHPDGKVGPYLASLARLEALRPSILYPGHGETVPDPAAKLREYREHRMDRAEQILTAIRQDGARTLAEIRDAVYGPLPEGVMRPAELTILAHLEHLLETGHELPEGVGRLAGAGERPTGD